jgi:hypothetical protein
MKIMHCATAVFLCFALSHGASVDSVTVDSVWNSDSSWHDGNGVLQQKLARDCFVSFIPQGSGYASCSLTVSLDSGRTWGASPNPLQILDNSLSTSFQCGKKGHAKVRVVGSDRSKVVFKIIARICTSGSDEPIAFPSAATAILFSEGFGNGLSKWESTYMVLVNDFYPQMRITTAAAHTGTHSITSDSNRTALVYRIVPRLEPSNPAAAHYIVGVQFYIMASAAGQANFSVQFGQDNGSSGGLGKAFGFGFDKSDSIKTTFYDTWAGLSPEVDSLLSPIQLTHWYKCNVEIDLGTTWTATWTLDGKVVKTMPLPTSEMNGIDRVLVFRGAEAGMTGADGLKPYYADDIVLYMR